MTRAFIIGAVAATMSLATAATAAEHEILILPDTYFPETTYLNPGDTVRFINSSGDVHTIIAANESWSIGPLDLNEEYTLAIDEEIERTFHNANVVNSDGTYAITGDISFDDGPIE